MLMCLTPCIVCNPLCQNSHMLKYFAQTSFWQTIKNLWKGDKCPFTKYWNIHEARQEWPKWKVVVICENGISHLWCCNIQRVWICEKYMRLYGFYGWLAICFVTWEITCFLPYWHRLWLWLIEAHILRAFNCSSLPSFNPSMCGNRVERIFDLVVQKNLDLIVARLFQTTGMKVILMGGWVVLPE
jgi:hypothetical protein